MTEDFLLRFLFPDIEQAVEGHYGQFRQFMNPRILDIKRLPYGQYYFEITVQVETFEGAHNPPYGLETITFATDPAYPKDGIKMTGYRHQDVLVRPGRGRECCGCSGEMSPETDWLSLVIARE